MEEVRSSFIPRENTLSFSHGHGWRSQPTKHGDSEGDFQEHSVELSLPFEDIRQNRLDAMARFHSELIDAMQRSFMINLYGTVTKAVEKTGNTVSATDHASLAATFLDAMKRIEFGVGRDGEISMPEFHGSKEMHEKFLASLDAQGAEFVDELNHVKATKTAEAFAREEERVSKFVKATLR